MRLQSLNESVTTEDGVVQLAFDLSRSEAGYLIISCPVAAAGGVDEFFGADHYVEVKDQMFGAYGGLQKLTVLDDRFVAIELATEVPGVGREISHTHS